MTYEQWFWEIPKLGNYVGCRILSRAPKGQTARRARQVRSVWQVPTLRQNRAKGRGTQLGLWLAGCSLSRGCCRQRRYQLLKRRLSGAGCFGLLVLDLQQFTSTPQKFSIADGSAIPSDNESRVPFILRKFFATFEQLHDVGLRYGRASAGLLARCEDLAGQCPGGEMPYINVISFSPKCVEPTQDIWLCGGHPHLARTEPS